MHNLLNEIAVTIIAATIAGLFCHLLRQPIILGYVLAGVVISDNFGLGIVKDPHTVEIISELGLILLLYVIGLEINIQNLIKSGRQLLVTSFGQFPLSVLIGLGFFSLTTVSYISNDLEIFYVAVLCALSSTAIVVKGLLDKGELDTLAGRMTLGTLVIQDMYAIIVLAVQPNFSSPQLMSIVTAIINTLFILCLGFIVSKYILSRLFRTIAKSPEMIVCLSVGWCATMSALADIVGVSREMGALVAGLSISAFPYSVNITAKTLPLRDFFLTLFFASLGMKLILPTGPLVLPVLTTSLFIIFSRFLTVYPLLISAGAGRRIAFITSLNLSQLSEFSLVIGSIGLTLNHVSQNFVSLLVFSMVFLSVISAYAIKFSHEIYLLFNKTLLRIGLNDESIADQTLADHKFEIIFLGYHRVAMSILTALESHSPSLLNKIMIVDFNPLTLKELEEKGFKTVFGDIASFEILKHSHLENAKIVISSIPDMLLKGTNNSQLIKMVKEINPEIYMISTADSEAHESDLLECGANLVVRPFDISGKWIAQNLSKIFSNNGVILKFAQS